MLVAGRARETTLTSTTANYTTRTTRHYRHHHQHVSTHRGYHQHDHHSDASTHRHYHYHVSERQAVATEGHTDLASVVRQGNHVPSSHKERLSSAIIHTQAASWVVTRTNQPISGTTSWWVFIQTNQLGALAGHEAADQHTTSRQVSQTNQYSRRPTNRPAVQPVGRSHSRPTNSTRRQSDANSAPSRVLVHHGRSGRDVWSWWFYHQGTCYPAMISAEVCPVT